jgi:hypothetical protein
VHASAHPGYRDRYARTKKRLGRQRGPAVARTDLARDLAGAIWQMLTCDQDFAPRTAPAGAAVDLAVTALHELRRREHPMT